jgi:hypothetical protein
MTDTQAVEFRELGTQARQRSGPDGRVGTADDPGTLITYYFRRRMPKYVVSSASQNCTGLKINQRFRIPRVT